MKKEVWLKYYNRLPDPAKSYLKSNESGLQEDLAQEHLGYDYDVWRRVSDVVWELLFEKISEEAFRKKLALVAGDRIITELEGEVLLRMVYPLADLVPWDVESRMQELGVPPEKISTVSRISIMPVTYSAAARRIASLANVSVLQEELLRRLRDLLVSVITGVRSDDQALEFLQRKQTEGGLGFTLPQAESYLASMNAFLLTASVMSEQEYSEWYRTSRLREQAMWNTDFRDDEENDEQSEPSEASINTARLKRQYEPVLEKAMQECLQQIGDLPLDDYLEKRLENVISTRLRNVRNALQTSSILTRDDKIGGLGLDAEKAERVARIIEASYELHHGEIEDDQKRRIQETEVAQKQKVEDRKKRESEEHAEWYQQKVAPPSFTNVMTTQQTTQAAQSMAQAPIRSNMSGVTAPAVSQLSDLIGEFKTMDIQEFRRLAKDPDQAGEKLFQKFETLRAESFERYTAGIAAWRQSPLQQRYLQLVSESFTRGKTVAEVAAAKLAQDPATPSPAELGAIITLNAKIQY